MATNEQQREAFGAGYSSGWNDGRQGDGYLPRDAFDLWAEWNTDGDDSADRIPIANVRTLDELADLTGPESASALASAPTWCRHCSEVPGRHDPGCPVLGLGER